MYSTPVDARSQEAGAVSEFNDNEHDTMIQNMETQTILPDD